MSNFDSLKRNRSSLEKLTKAIEATTQSTSTESGSREDPRLWQPTVDKAGNGMAIIRFLPAPSVDGEDALPWVRVFSHGFQGPGGWYIENSLTTLNQKDPVSEYNSTLWNSGIEANKEIARKQKRRLNYVANVFVVSDPSNPENEGQIRIYKFGKKIFDKITEAMNPEFADETPVNPFDMWEGANFKLKIRNVEGYRNYDKSEFAEKSALLDGDDAKLEALWKQEHSLKEFLDPKHFKPYDLLKARLDKVLGFEGDVAPKSKAIDAVVENFNDSQLNAIDTKIATSEDDDDLNYFKSLAE
tara:strand:- start:236 stop:1135 length:900 start_codon:yes stop_codon:yes gene_type:complete